MVRSNKVSKILYKHNIVSFYFFILGYGCLIIVRSSAGTPKLPRIAHGCAIRGYFKYNLLKYINFNFKITFQNTLKCRWL